MRTLLIYSAVIAIIGPVIAWLVFVVAGVARGFRKLAAAAVSANFGHGIARLAGCPPLYIVFILFLAV